MFWKHAPLATKTLQDSSQQEESFFCVVDEIHLKISIHQLTLQNRQIGKVYQPAAKSSKMEDVIVPSNWVSLPSKGNHSNWSGIKKLAYNPSIAA